MSRGRMTTEKYVARLLGRVEKREDGCWIWTGSTHGPSGRGGLIYGRCIRDGKAHVVHRFIYQALRGPVSSEEVLDHLCRSTLCVNPDHLEPVSNRTNIRRGTAPTARNYRKTHCKRGHRFDAENAQPVTRDGEIVGVECRACRRIISKRHYDRHRHRRLEQSRRYREEHADELREKRRAKRVRADGLAGGGA